MIAALFVSVSAGYALPKCPNSPTTDSKVKNRWDNCTGTYTSANGAKYVGEFKDGKYNGQFTVTYASGNKYVGEFKDGKYNGQGTYTFGISSEWAGAKYVGEFKDDNYNGQGTLTFASGNKYVGEFKDGKRNGQGTYTSANGTVQQGPWRLGKFQGVTKPTPTKPKVEPTPPRNNVDPNKTFNVASGSGFYVSVEGHIITNHHVIDGCKEMKVHSNGSVLKAVPIADDPRNDLALLKVSKSPKAVFPMSTESSYPLQEIVVAGFPFGNNVSSTLKFTQGIVSSVAGIGNDYSQIQIDAALQPGNSGGPILDEYGNVVAVAVAKLSLEKILEDYGVIPENTNFGVKSSAVRNLMEGNGVAFKSPNTRAISKRDLSKVATDGTVFLSCWMTTAQLEKMKTRKVLFTDFD